MATTMTCLRLLTLLPLLLLTSLGHAISLHDKVKNSKYGIYGSKHNPITRRSVTLDLQRNPDYAPNGPAAYARALQKWGADVPGELADSLAVMRGDGALFSLSFSLPPFILVVCLVVRVYRVCVWV
jgi:hypothetical protein